MANTCKLTYLIASFSMLLMVGCSSKQNVIANKNGKLSYSVIKGTQNRTPVITGVLYDYESNKPVATHGAIKIKYKIMARTNTEGDFSFSIDRGLYRFTIVAYPYRPMVTGKIRVDNGDTLKLKVFLMPDHSPLD